MSAEITEERIWQMCQYLNEQERDCRHCPAHCEIPGYGPGVHGCRSLAEETIRVALTGSPFEPRSEKR